MTQSSFHFLFSSNSSCHRLVTLITILLLNPLPIIYGAPTQKIDNDLTAVQRHKRQIISDDDDNGINYINPNEYLTESKPELVFEGLLGCKYDINVCNENEACFDDGLFGQCWDGEGSERSAFALKYGVDGLSDDKLIAMESTLNFLNRYQLNWRDYMTQCILSHIFSEKHQINRNHLEKFYHDCLNKDQLLDELATTQEENIYRRQLEYFDQNRNFYYKDPYIPLTKSDNIVISFEKSYGNPLLMEYNRPDEIEISPMTIALAQAVAEQEELRQQQQPNRFDTYYIDNDEIILDDQPTKLIAEESIMHEPKKKYLYIQMKAIQVY